MSIPTALRIAFIPGNQSQRTRSGKMCYKSDFNQQSLVDGGKILYESSIIVEYLNDQYNLGLLPKDPYERAKGKLVIDIINKKIIPAYFRTLQLQEPDQQALGRADIIAGLKEFAEKLPKDDGPFYRGKNFGFVDIELAPWVLRYHLRWSED
jgi:glutathione S-transferase